MAEPLLKKIADRVVKPVLARYLQKERRFRYRGFDLIVFPGVFHPAFFFSSKYLFEFVSKLDLRGKNCLEIGSGAGLISLCMAAEQGVVTAIDISQDAVRNTKLNFERNKQQIHSDYSVIQSDLFEQLGSARFDYIVINPPYFFKEASTESQYAWNCGQEGEYFQKLFAGLSQHLNPAANVYMILADNCDVARISGIAAVSGWVLRKTEQKKIWWETNYIYAIEPEPSSKIG